ncbi:MAG: pantoate--beta-alanine ligase [Candidatus Marinimicrobia bacterium]|jgi:pantoate--beta-alanine ligase|nr:pantoate--beta-alanine ligase [Candidatus Neomarinimicrobiota bacterium]MCK9484846.1 pantoate--beta-alanine ligase [Candidatus Neomarinimicrobiota bacterium]MCK9560606.1 pantoate--beta-alanine ligase [Candidatus Neomarinimicrobiota bacterium]MDD5541127.1 pantoate--beta-alanine ligase [Candidatus Neomarinimicrobiota bacterium]
MQILTKIDDICRELRKVRLSGKIIGLVPTMGYLHEGHLSLVDVANDNADVVVMSIFVNPTQFAPNEDLARYPRDFARDEKLARERGVDYIFYPESDEMYPAPYFTYVVTEQMAKVLCGVSRPIHFRGVTTIVAKLFNIVQPDVAVFGQKDAQQAIIIRQMVRDLNFPIRIIVAPIVREPDGLALSSRNVYLSSEERAQAPIIYKALSEAKAAVEQDLAEAGQIAGQIRQTILTTPLARIDYVEIVDDRTLQPVKVVEPGTFVAVAVYYGKTRLIDNVYLKER